MNYESSQSVLPPQQVLLATPSNPATLLWHSSWGVTSRLIPFMEQGPMFNAINFTLKTSVPANSTIVSTRLSVLACPSEVNQEPLMTATSTTAVSNYGWCAGDWYVYGGMAMNNAPSPAAPSTVTSAPSPGSCRCGCTGR